MRITGCVLKKKKMGMEEMQGWAAEKREGSVLSPTSEWAGVERE